MDTSNRRVRFESRTPHNQRSGASDNEDFNIIVFYLEDTYVVFLMVVNPDGFYRHGSGVLLEMLACAEHIPGD
jgi:hypothetical protein